MKDENFMDKKTLKDEISFVQSGLYGNCRFCKLRDNKSEKPLYDSILYENDYFFVVPALGCLVRGYIMIISKRHIHSMCYLNETEKNELKNVIDKFCELFNYKYDFYPIVFEHGASVYDTNKSACCVLHAHVHVVPYRITCQSNMVQSLGLLQRSDISEFFSEGYDKPYIFFMDNFGTIYHRNFDKDVLPSQIMRKWIAKDKYNNDPNAWDWRQRPFEENIDVTVNELKPLIRKKILTKDYRLQYVYYCRAMDGLNVEEIESEYKYVQKKLAEHGRVLVNPFEKAEYKKLNRDKTDAELVISKNIKAINMADCVVINISIKNHIYIECATEMVYAKEKGCYVIVISGDTGVEKYLHTMYHTDKICHSLDELLNKENWRD